MASTIPRSTTTPEADRERRVLVAEVAGGYERAGERRGLVSFADRSTAALPTVTYLLASGSDRIGANDFQASSDTYVPRETNATLDQVATCVDAAGEFLLSEARARAIIDRLVQTIIDEFGDAAGRAGLTEVDRKLLWRRAFLHPYAFEDYGLAPA